MATTYAEALQRGYNSVYALVIEGLPYIFTEKNVQRLDSIDTLGVASTPGATAVECLYIKDDQTITQELDRETGIAAGDALEIILTFEGLQLADLLDQLFRRPTALTDLTADVDESQTTIDVEDTSSFPASGAFFLGLERIEYAGKTATSFTGCTRGTGLTISGSFDQANAYIARANSVGAYRTCTDLPIFWKGRTCTLFEHLISPEERSPSTNWCDGTYCRMVWNGYIDEAPKAVDFGMQLRALPLVRRLDRKAGMTLTAKVAVPNINFSPFPGADNQNWICWLVPVTNSNYINVSFEHSGGTIDEDIFIYAGGANPAFMALNYFVDAVKVAFEAWTAATAVILSTHVYIETAGEHIAIKVVLNGVTYTTALKITVPGGFGGLFVPGENVASNYSGAAGIDGLCRCPIDSPSGQTWVLLTGLEGQAWNDWTMPSAGVALLESGDLTEIVRYESSTSFDVLGAPEELWSSGGAGNVALNLIERRVAGTPLVDVWYGGEGTVSVSVGDSNNVSLIMKKLLESSGTGLRGNYDIFDLGLGYGITDIFVDEPNIDAAFSTPEMEVTAIKKDASSMSDLLGGWIALKGLCFAMTNGDNNIPPIEPANTIQRLRLVPWRVTKDPDATVIGKGDVLLDGSMVRDILDGPNEIKMQTNSLHTPGTDLTIRDIPRIQAEGCKSVTFEAPSMPEDMAVHYGAQYLALSEGLVSLKLKCGPWVDLQLGDPAILQIDHPILFDWDTGTRNPATAYARVVGVNRNLTNQTQEITFLTSGQASLSLILCPTATIQNVSGASNEIWTLDDGETDYFKVGDVINVYNRGNDDTEHQDLQVSAVTTSTIEIFAPIPGWVATGSRVTFPDYVAAGPSVTDQRDFAYVRADKAWYP